METIEKKCCHKIWLNKNICAIKSNAHNLNASRIITVKTAQRQQAPYVAVVRELCDQVWGLDCFKGGKWANNPITF